MKPGLKMSELADASGVSAATIKHYLREGLLGGDDEIVRTSRNMAYYPPEFVERIRRIKHLQGERFLPLRLIKVLLDEQGGGPVPRADVAERHAMPANVLDRLEEIGVLTPGPEGYDPDDVKIIEAIARFRAGGYDEALDSELVRARGMVAELAQPGASEPVRLLGVPVKLSRTPGDPARAPGPALGADTEAVLAEAGYGADEIQALLAAGAVAGPAGDSVAGSFMA